MYPIISIGSFELHMTGLAIIAGLVTFLITAYILSRQHKIQFIKLFYWLPLPLILIYILGSYSSFIINQGKRLPITINDLTQIASPYGYTFHFIGIIIAAAISVWLFLRKIPSRHERHVRIDIIASSITVALVPLGLGLLMGDTLIGMPTESRIGVESLRPDISARSTYAKVYPIGLFIAIIGLVTFIAHNIKTHHKKPSGQGYLTLGVATLLIGYTRIFVNTPKYLVFQV